MPIVLTYTRPDGTCLTCGPDCYRKPDHPCVCICGGVNHGVGYERALANSYELYRRLPDADRCRWRLHPHAHTPPFDFLSLP